MDYRKIDTFFIESRIDMSMISQANFDLVGYEKRKMTNKLTDMATHKHTANVMLHLVFSEEDITPDNLTADIYRVHTNGFKKIRAKLEVFQANE